MMATGNEIAVNINNLSYTYPTGTKALVDVNLEIRNGEYLAIMASDGEDGLRKVVAGLTTLEEVLRVTMGDSA